MSTTTQIHDAKETMRNVHQDRANERRFFEYNERRIKHGLEPFKFEDYMARKHGFHSVREQIRRAIQPQHRDNVVLLTR
ncbi:MAG: hypothetical protein HOB14_13165 [Gammaproteobacteria bacterium]|jgi:hypothetical protein|nr:hypothetical protein [Gammaproteobacteria bacterium]MBT6702604.1 hypothetical protein [Gammaproteobacteria bacterium]